MRLKHIPKVRCTACNGKIAIDQVVIENFKYYHKNCLLAIKQEKKGET